MMQSNKIQYTDNKKERILSGIITFIISSIILAFILLYKTTFITVTPPTYIDINFESDDLGANFGTDEVGLGEEEPADQDVQFGTGGDPFAAESPDGSSSAITNESEEDSKSYLSDPASKEPSPVVSKKAEVKKNTTPKPETPKTSTKQATNSSTSKTSTAKKSNTKAGAGGEGTTGGNPKGNAAVGALLKGKGTSTSSTGEGTGGRPGQNQGVPDGGSGSGGEGIGNGRKLVSFIPGTMGRGGNVPSHDCTGAGTVIFSYTVDKNGTVTSVSRQSGPSNTCMVNTGIKWIKQYVKADKGTRSVSGTYKITF